MTRLQYEFIIPAGLSSKDFESLIQSKLSGLKMVDESSKKIVSTKVDVVANSAMFVISTNECENEQ